MACVVCNNTDGPCQPKKRDFSFFMVKVPDDFQVLMNVPCYAREKLNMVTEGVSNIYVEDNSGVGYTLKLQKLPTKTSFTGQAWKTFLNDYKLKAGDLILFEFSKDGVSPNRILAYDEKCKIKYNQIMEDTSSGSSDEESDDLEQMFKKHNVVVITRKLELTTQNFAYWEVNIARKGTGIGHLFVHKLIDTNIDSKKLKIPVKIVQALNLDFEEVVVLSADNIEDVQDTYSPCGDGRMAIDIDTWATIVKAKGFTKGQVVMFLFHPYGDRFTSRTGVVISVHVI